MQMEEAAGLNVEEVTGGRLSLQERQMAVEQDDEEDHAASTAPITAARVQVGAARPLRGTADPLLASEPPKRPSPTRTLIGPTRSVRQRTVARQLRDGLLATWRPHAPRKRHYSLLPMSEPSRVERLTARFCRISVAVTLLPVGVAAARQSPTGGSRSARTRSTPSGRETSSLTMFRWSGRWRVRLGAS